MGKFHVTIRDVFAKDLIFNALSFKGTMENISGNDFVRHLVSPPPPLRRHTMDRLRGGRDKCRCGGRDPSQGASCHR